MLSNRSELHSDWPAYPDRQRHPAVAMSRVNRPNQRCAGPSQRFSCGVGVEPFEERSISSWSRRRQAPRSARAAAEGPDTLHGAVRFVTPAPT